MQTQYIPNAIHAVSDTVSATYCTYIGYGCSSQAGDTAAATGAPAQSPAEIQASGAGTQQDSTLIVSGNPMAVPSNNDLIDARQGRVTLSPTERVAAAFQNQTPAPDTAVANAAQSSSGADTSGASSQSSPTSLNDRLAAWSDSMQKTYIPNAIQSVSNTYCTYVGYGCSSQASDTAIAKSDTGQATVDSPTYLAVAPADTGGAASPSGLAERLSSVAPETSAQAVVEGAPREDRLSPVVSSAGSQVVPVQAGVLTTAAPNSQSSAGSVSVAVPSTDPTKRVNEAFLMSGSSITSQAQPEWSKYASLSPSSAGGSTALQPITPSAETLTGTEVAPAGLAPAPVSPVTSSPLPAVAAAPTTALPTSFQQMEALPSGASLSSQIKTLGTYSEREAIVNQYFSNELPNYSGQYAENQKLVQLVSQYGAAPASPASAVPTLPTTGVPTPSAPPAVTVQSVAVGVSGDFYAKVQTLGTIQNLTTGQLVGGVSYADRKQYVDEVLGGTVPGAAGEYRGTGAQNEALVRYLQQQLQ